MADIRIEKKHKPIWPWIIGLAFLVLIVWGLFEGFNSKRMQNTVAVTAPTDNEAFQRTQSDSVKNQGKEDALEPVASFVDFATASSGKPVETVNSGYTAQGLNKLADALEASSEVENVKTDSVENSLVKIRNTAGFIEENPGSTAYLDSVSTAFHVAANTLEQLKAEGATSADEGLKKLHRTADKVKTSAPALEQKRAVKNFFAESAQALQVFASNVDNTNTNRED